MKILNYIEAINYLNKDKINGLVLIYGEENYLIDYFMDVLKSEYLEIGFEDFNYEKIDSKVSFKHLKESCETIPFGSGKRIVEVRGIDLSRDSMTKNKELLAELKDY
ncbi:MAG: hypothetical protein Q4P34_06190, partial [Tissierellia bacterium]|nr:hypothetical protein [Tissierellia bacterium]